jgi:hypothetical protein
MDAVAIAAARQPNHQAHASDGAPPMRQAQTRSHSL